MKKRVNICVLGIILSFVIVQNTYASNSESIIDSQEIKLHLKDSVEVTTPRVYAKDISTCTGDINLCEEVLGVDLGLNMEADQSITFDKKSLKDILQNEFPNTSITFNSVDQTQLKSVGSTLDSTVIGQRLQSSLNKLFKKFPGYSAEISSIKTPSNIKVWKGQYKVKFPSLENEEYYDVTSLMKKCLGHKTVKVKLVPVSSGNPKEFVIHINTAVKQQIPIATNIIERGQILSKNNFDIRWYQLKFAHQNIINSDEMLIGKRVKRKIMPGSPFLSEMVEVPPVVTRGQIVKLIINKKYLNIAASVKTLSEGRVGETIKVLFPISNRQMYAKVLDSSSVESVD